MRHSRRSLALAVSISGVLAGCATRHHVPPPVTADSNLVSLENTMLEIENHNWSDIVVFALHDGRSSRIAQVTAGRSISVPLLPQHFSAMGTFKLAVHPIGGSSDFTSESLSLRTGNTVRLTVESKVGHSSVAVW
jgi:hypothetical protein